MSEPPAQSAECRAHPSLHGLDWPRVLAVAAIAAAVAISAGCARHRQATASSDGGGAIVAPDSGQSVSIGRSVDDAVMLRAAEQRFPNVAARSHRPPVLWFVADPFNRVLATRRDDTISASTSFEDVKRQFPDVDLSHLLDVQVFYGPGSAATGGPVTIVWARVGAKGVASATISPETRAIVAGLVAHYYGTPAVPATGHIRTVWFVMSPSGVVLAHGDGRPARALSGMYAVQILFAPGELLSDSTRATVMIE